METRDQKYSRGAPSEKAIAIAMIQMKPTWRKENQAEHCAAFRQLEPRRVIKNRTSPDTRRYTIRSHNQIESVTTCISHVP